MIEYLLSRIIEHWSESSLQAYKMLQRNPHDFRNMEILRQIIIFLLILAPLVTRFEATMHRQREYSSTSQPAEGRVQIRVFRGPNHSKGGVQWGFYVKQPADFSRA